ncbi:MAG: DedA family protein, partial [Candidatus Angelobacter sp.]
LRDRFEKQEFLALMVPAMLPPPTPFKLFVFSAGVFKMRVVWFLLAIASGRLFRFAILSALTIAFGPQIVNEARDLLLHHLGYTLLGAVLFLLGLYFIFRHFRSPMAKIAQELQNDGPATKPNAELH